MPRAVLIPRNQIAERGDMAQTFHRYRAGDKPVGGYKLVRKLGEGAAGEVGRAKTPGAHAE